MNQFLAGWRSADARRRDRQYSRVTTVTLDGAKLLRYEVCDSDDRGARRQPQRAFWFLMFAAAKLGGNVAMSVGRRVRDVDDDAPLPLSWRFCR